MENQTKSHNKVYKVLGIIFVCWLVFSLVVAGRYAFYILPLIVSIGVAFSLSFVVSIKIFPRNRVIDVVGKWITWLVLGVLILSVLVEIIKALGLIEPI